MALAAHKFLSSCVACLVLVVSHMAMAQNALDKFARPPFRELSRPVRLDELGDPLPPQARFQFGTERYVAPRPVFDMALSPDGKTVLTRDSENMHCWDAASGKIRWTAAVDSQWGAAYGLRAFAFSGSSEFFYSQSGPEMLLQWKIHFDPRHKRFTPTARKSPGEFVPWSHAGDRCQSRWFAHRRSRWAWHYCVRRSRSQPVGDP
jgi:hypothetical protein